MKTVSTIVLALILVILTLVVIKRGSLRDYRARAFVAAAAKGDLGRMRFWCAIGADPKALVPGMSPPLSAAAGSGSVDAIRFLLERGADLEQKDKEGNTPLIEAAVAGRVEAVRYLLDRGANVNAISGDGSALKLAIEYKHREAAELLRLHGGRDCVNYPVYSCK